MTNEEVLQYVVKSIRIIRKNKKVSQTELGLRANMSQGFLTDLETGKKEPSAMTLIRIARALEVSPRDFFPDSACTDEINVRSQIKGEIMELLKRL